MPCLSLSAQMCETFYLFVFTTELLIKIVAYGLFFHDDAYLRDGWCQLDFVVVSFAWLPILVPGFGNFSAIRAFRALRPLRALKRVPGMPVLVQSILGALPRVGNVLMLMSFIMLVFAIVGVELFKGILHYRCARPGFVETEGHPTGVADAAAEEEGHRRLAYELISGLGSAAVPFSSSSSHSGRGLASRLVSREHDQSAWDTDQPCSLTAARKGGGDECYGDQTCMYFDRNPSNNLMSFDHVGVAFVVLLQVHAFASLYTHTLSALPTHARGCSSTKPLTDSKDEDKSYRVSIAD